MNLDKLTTIELDQVRAIRIRAVVYLVLQTSGFAGAIYLACDPLDFVFDETKYLAIFIAVLVYLFFFIAMTLRIVLKTAVDIDGSRKWLIIIGIADIIPSILLMLLALNDIF